MNYSLSLFQRVELMQRLNQTQSQQLQQLLLLQQKLKHPKFPDASKGFEGMIVADEILRKNNCRGVLIGGLSELVWNMRRKREDLQERKDVDVFVLGNYRPETFEAGIDWWTSYEERMKVWEPNATYTERTLQWWENGNEVVLGFGAYLNPKTSSGRILDSGLYIPSTKDVVAMRAMEAVANAGRGIEISEVVLDKYREKVGKRMRTRVPKFIERQFKGRILDSRYTSNLYLNTLKFEGLSNPELLAIKVRKLQTNRT